MKLLLLLLLFNFSLFAYTAKYMDNEDVGYSVFGSYESEELAGGNTETTTTFGANYFMKENIEFVFSYMTSEFDDKVDNGAFDASLSGSAIGGFYHIRDNTMPFNISVGGEFGSITADADYLDELGWKIEGDASTFGGEVYKELSTSEKFNLTGFIGFSVIDVKTTLSDSYGDSISESDKSNVLNFGVGFVLSNGLVIQPSISKIEDESSFDISFAYIIK